MEHGQAITLYCVKGGDTLSAIALRFLGNAHRWTEIQREDPRTQNCADIRPGETLKIFLNGQSAAPATDPVFVERLVVWQLCGYGIAAAGDVGGTFVSRDDARVYLDWYNSRQYASRNYTIEPLPVKGRA